MMLVTTIVNMMNINNFYYNQYSILAAIWQLHIRFHLVLSNKISSRLPRYTYSIMK